MKRIKLFLVRSQSRLSPRSRPRGAYASDSTQSGAVYTLTNSPAGNAVAVFDRPRTAL
jgi:hypothetical protein